MEDKSLGVRGNIRMIPKSGFGRMEVLPERNLGSVGKVTGFEGKVISVLSD